jgi:ribosomal protein L7Ae-like RNA K-turn-binding protein
VDVAHAKMLRLLGLGVRARGAVVGVDRVRDAAKDGTLVLAVVAPNASRHSLDKVVPLLTARRVLVIEGPSAEMLGRAVGRETTAAVGVTDPNLARGIREALETAALRRPEAGDASGTGE